LGEFRVLIDDLARVPARRAQVKVLELLKALVATGPSAVSSERLSEWLWPESEGDAAAINLRTNVLRLRQLLGNDTAVQVQDNKVRLNADLCWVDAWAFEHLSAVAAGHGAGDDRAATLSTAVELYRGHLLEEESYAWAIRRRDRLRSRFVSTLQTLALGREAYRQCRRGCRPIVMMRRWQLIPLPRFVTIRASGLAQPNPLSIYSRRCLVPATYLQRPLR
jgi:LuxR family transcriptional regulator, maltose regulon positive regulatory protein